MITIVQWEKKYRWPDPPELRALAKVEAELLKCIRTYFDKKGFIEVIVPHITRATGSCENMNTVFDLNYFNERAYLMQTGQLFLEVLVPILNKVWCAGPSFRAEPTVNNRHLTEFTLIEMEFVGNLEDLMLCIEDIFQEMILAVLLNRDKELELLGVERCRLKELKIPFRKISYDEAVNILGIKWGHDLKSKHEKHLVEIYGGHPLFITHYPEHLKFFNMKTNSKNPKVVNCVDLILPFSGEAVGTAEREYEYERVYEKLKRSSMLRQLEEKGGNINDFQWYLDNLKEKGSVPHAGFGMGLNRVTQFILSRNDIRMSTIFPINKETLM